MEYVLWGCYLCPLARLTHFIPLWDVYPGCDCSQNFEDEVVARKAALDKVLSEIEANFGKGSVMKLGDQANHRMETTSSGSLSLDLALGG